MRAHHTFAQRGGHKGFELVQHFRLCGGRVDQLHQLHVTRWVEEMNTAKAGLDRIGQSLAELGDGQARGVGCHQRMLGNEGGDLVIQVQLPVHALSNGLNHQITAFEQLHMLFVVGRLDQIHIIGHANG